DELIVGKYFLRQLTQKEQAELDHFRENIEPYRVIEVGQRAHMAIDFEKLLHEGVDGIRKEINAYREGLTLTNAEDYEKDVFYRSSLMSLDALINAAHHYAALAEQQSLIAAPVRRDELLRIAKICRHVPEYPARNFYEAIQCVHFVNFALCAAHQMSLMQYGHPDRYLLRFYEQDLSEGRITREEAQELIDCLAVILTEYTPQHLAIGWMLGGRDETGQVISNELTEMFLISLNHVPLAYPCTGLAWTDDTPEHIKELAADLLSHGLSHPAIFNDQVITQGLIDLGLSPVEACRYQQSTCVEITPCASSNVYVASPYINLPQILQDILGIPSMVAEDEEALQSVQYPASFADLLQTYRKRLAAVIEDAVIEQNTIQMTRRYNGGKALLSCFVNDCLAKGLDIDHGGARYNWIEPSFVGLANTVDALFAIQKVVYEQQQVDIGGLADALRKNFTGCEDLRCQLEQRIEKYGNDQDKVDDLAQTITNWVAELTHQHRGYLGGRYVSGFFCWIMHERLGAQTAATPDGRKAGFPLGDGSGPAQGRERQGPTAAILSTTKWDHQSHIGGIALNLKFTSPTDRVGFNQNLVDLIDTYILRGGFEIQVNVVDREKLLDAQQHPEQYQDLVVRIGGYSDYFVRLSPEMQAEVILRTNH
ncbi:MAG: pyruvate formate lyase family protein, partial [Anaerolineae bacterium]|nr:pyruvate formate lyase family protein [Anaerolineae bacterium]